MLALRFAAGGESMGVDEPLSFNEQELRVLEALARPIDPPRRDEFLQRVGEQLNGARGEGRVHQVARQVQRDFWTPPELNSKEMSGPRRR
jgi:hypothetical protein